MAGLLCHAVLLLCPLSTALAEPPAGSAFGNARLLTTDEAAVIAHPVLGLQRSALPLGAGLALDTSLYADLFLAPNLGLRWAMEAGPHRVVFGARYTHFVGSSVYSSFVEGQEAEIDSFEPSLSGPTVYGVYGFVLGPLTVQGEARYAHYDSDYLAATGGVALHLTETFALMGELGVRLKGGSKLRAAGGMRYGGEHLGAALGIAYVNIDDPAFPDGGFAVLPVFDLTWTFR
jgi:hypothetical protein